MRNREDLLQDVLDLNREIEEKQKEINKLCREAEKIEDKDDDESGRNGGYLDCILSYEVSI